MPYIGGKFLRKLALGETLNNGGLKVATGGD